MKNTLLNLVVASIMIVSASFTYAQSCDTLRNYDRTDDLFELSAPDGYIWGHSSVDIGMGPENVTEWAEQYTLATLTEVRRLSFIPWTVTDGGGSVTFSLRPDAGGVPGTAVLGSETLTLASLTENVLEYVDFPAPSPQIVGTFWVVMELNYSNPTDDLALLGTYEVGGGPNTTFMNTAATGWQTPDYWFTLGTNDKVRWALDVLTSNGPDPVADFDFNQRICIDGQFSVDGSLSQNTTDYFWVLGDNPFTTAYDTNEGLTATLDPTISGGSQVIFLVADGSCRTDVVGYIANVDPAVSATTASTNEFCGQGNGTISFTNPQGGFGTYEYSIDGTTYVTTPNFTGLGEGTYTVYVRTAGDGCETSYTVNVNETLAQPITMGAAPTSCAGESVSISASGSGTIEWFNGATSLGTGAAINVSPTATTSYTAVLTDANGCESTGNVNVNVNALPTVTASIDQAICIGDNATISVTGSAVNYTWDNGLGAGVSQLVTPTATTTYQVTGVDGNNCQNTDVVIINVNQIDNASFTLNNFCVGAANQATGIALTGGTFSFNPAVADGASIDASTGEITNGVLGTTYSVEYATNGPCPSTSIESTTVQAGDDPSFVFDNICVGAAALPTSVATTGGSFAFNPAPADGATIDPATGEVSNSVAGNSYQIEYTTPTGICQASEIITVNAFDLPTVTTSTDETICDGDVVVISATGADTYTWDNGLGAGDTHSVSPSANTTYNVVGTDPNGCSASAAVIINVNPTPSIDAGGDETVCEGTTITLTAVNPDGAVITWDNSVTDGVGFTPTATTTYEVSAVLGTCTATDDVTITVVTAPVVDAGNDIEACEGEEITLTANNPSGASITWDNGVTDGVAFTVSSTGTYTVSGDLGGCIGTDDVLVTVNPLPTVSMGADEELCNTAGIFSLTGTPAGGVFTGPGVTGTDFDPSVAGVGTHTINYEYVDMNGCSNSATAVYTVDDCASLEENNLSNSLILAPNPSSTHVDIQVSGNELTIVSIRLVSLEGRVLEVRNNAAIENTIRLDVSSYAKGTYMAIITTSKGEVTKKFIVQ